RGDPFRERRLAAAGLLLLPACHEGLDRRLGVRREGRRGARARSPHRHRDARLGGEHRAADRLAHLRVRGRIRQRDPELRRRRAGPGRVDRPGMARRRDRAHPGGDLRVGADRAGDLARLNRWPPTAVDFVIRVTEPWQGCGSSTGAVRRREPPVRARRLFDVQQSRSLLKFPDKDQAMEKILDLTMLSDIFPTGFHGAVSAGVEPGSSVYIAGAGPVGTAAAVGAQLLGASVVIMADMNADRLANAAKFGCETIDVSPEDPREGIARILGREEVDAGVDAVGFEARGPGKDAQEAPATVLNTLMDVPRAGGALGIPGLYVTGDPGGVDEA